LTNVWLHSLNGALVFVWLWQMTGARWRSLLVATLFAVHPLRVESVAWVAERKDVLSGCFGLFALMFYVRHAQGKTTNVPSRNTNYLLALLCFALGLMSKAMLVTWPFVMLLLDYWPLARFQLGSIWPLVKEKIPFFALAGGASIATYLVQQHSGAMSMGEDIPFAARGENAVISCCRYLGKLFWPTKLAVFYPHPGYRPLAEVLLASGLLAGISILAWRQRRHYPFLLTGWLWYGGTLLPVIGLIQVGEQSMPDRYTYLPSLGVLILLVRGGRWN